MRDRGAAQGYRVHDTSTNGTWILFEDGSKDRVPKGNSLPLELGQTVRLSTLTDGVSRDTVPECVPQGAAPVVYACVLSPLPWAQRLTLQ